MGAWSALELASLRRAISTVSCDLDKKERWRQISSRVPGRTSGECLEKYREMSCRGEEDLLVEDCDEEWKSKRPSSRRIIPSVRRHKSRMVTDDEAGELRRLVFGSGTRQTPRPWKEQGFVYSRHVSYGLVQHEGGPCGVLAVVQAHVIDQLSRRENDESKSRALSRALSTILWRCAASSTAIVCTPSSTTSFGRSASYIPDGVTEKMRIWHAETVDELREILWHHIDFFESARGCGALLFLYSALLSRSLEEVRRDADCGEDLVLVDRYGYASQEAVNLLLIGLARTNVFDGTKTLGDDKDVVVLRGIPSRSDFGLLTLDEANGYYEVGEFFKSPRSKIWVVYAESHYSVLFADDDCDSKAFHLQYYDCLGGQREKITLLVETTKRNSFDQPSQDEDIPPLDLVIRTKWRNASVDWLGTDPIL